MKGAPRGALLNCEIGTHYIVEYSNVEVGFLTCEKYIAHLKVRCYAKPNVEMGFQTY